MSTFAKSFKEEVSRLARKEARAAVAPIRKLSGATHSALADLKRRVAALEKESRRLSTLLAKRLNPANPVNPVEEQGRTAGRITGKGIRSLRRKLRLSGEQFGRLLNVSGPAVYAWEKRNGPLCVRQSTRTAILSIRTLGAREAKARLQEKPKK